LNYPNDYVELIVRISTFFAALLIIFKVPTKFLDLYSANFPQQNHSFHIVYTLKY